MDNTINLMEEGKYYHTYSENEGDMYVTVIEDKSLIVMKSPYTISYRRGIFSASGAKEISKEDFIKEFNEVIFLINVIKNSTISI